MLCYAAPFPRTYASCLKTEGCFFNNCKTLRPTKKFNITYFAEYVLSAILYNDLIARTGAYRINDPLKISSSLQNKMFFEHMYSFPGSSTDLNLT